MPNENSIYIIVSDEDQWIKKDAGSLDRFRNDKNREIRDMGRSIREHLSPIRWTTEKIFSGYQEKMDILREIDDQIKNWTKDLDNALDRAKESKKLGKPLDVIFWLGQINNRLKLVSDKKSQLSDIQDKDTDEYFQETEHGLQDDYFQSGEDKIVQAGIIDDTKRKITTWKIERMYKKRLEEQKRALITLLNLASNTVARVDNFLAHMSKARANGDISLYIQFLGKISEQQSKFELEFKSIYDRQFAPMIARIKENKKLEEERSKKITEEANQREKDRLDKLVEPPQSILPVTQPMSAIPPTEPKSLLVNIPPILLPTPPTPELEPDTTIFERKTPDPNSSKIIDLSTPESQDFPESDMKPTKKVEDLDISPETIRSAKSNIIKMIIKNNHDKFHKELEKAAIKNDPYLLAAMLMTYSQKIDEIDPEKSLELLSIAEGILNV
jgi:hypothetical protein